MKDERSPELNTPGFEPGTEWSEVSVLHLDQAQRAYISVKLSPPKILTGKRVCLLQGLFWRDCSWTGDRLAAILRPPVSGGSVWFYPCHHCVIVLNPQS